MITKEETPLKPPKKKRIKRPRKKRIKQSLKKGKNIVKNTSNLHRKNVVNKYEELFMAYAKEYPDNVGHFKDILLVIQSLETNKGYRYTFDDIMNMQLTMKVFENKTIRNHLGEDLGVEPNSLVNLKAIEILKKYAPKTETDNTELLTQILKGLNEPKT